MDWLRKKYILTREPQAIENPLPWILCLADRAEAIRMERGEQKVNYDFKCFGLES